MTEVQQEWQRYSEARALEVTMYPYQAGVTSLCLAILREQIRADAAAPAKPAERSK